MHTCIYIRLNNESLNKINYYACTCKILKNGMLIVYDPVKNRLKEKSSHHREIQCASSKARRHNLSLYFWDRRVALNVAPTAHSGDAKTMEYSPFLNPENNIICYTEV